MAESGRRRETAVLAAFVVLVAILYATYSLLRHANFGSGGYDLGIFDQGVRGYAGFGAPISSLKGPEFNLLGDHFHPVLVLFAPLYWVWDDPRMLLLAQAALVASSIVPVYRTAAARLGRSNGGLIAFGYAFGWPVQALVDFDFHEVAFALPVLAWAIYLLDRERYAAALAVASALLLVREDMGLVLVAFGLVLAVRRRWLLAGIAAVAGLGAYFVVTGVLIPAVAPDGFQYWTYDALGRDLPSAVRFLLTNPVAAARVFFEAPKDRTLLLLLAQTGVLGALSPVALLAVPLLAARFFSSRENLWTTEFHYNAPVALILTLAVVDTLARFPVARAWLARGVGVWMVFLAVSGTLLDAGLYPLKLLPRFAAGLDSDSVAQSRAAVGTVPPGVCVEAGGLLVPHLTPRNDVVLPGRSRGVADWLLLDMAKRDVGGPPEDIALPQYYLSTAIDDGLDVVGVHGSILVLHRPGTDAVRCFPG